MAALTRALSVAALSVIDGPCLFLADLHAGNIVVVPGAAGRQPTAAFLDFGCCGRLPPALRGALMMQASALMLPTTGGEAARRFTDGFAFSLGRMPGCGPKELDTAGLAADLAPLFNEWEHVSPFGDRGGAAPSDAELYGLLLRGQLALHRRGVQLPREFSLLIKTACFATLYFARLDAAHRDELRALLCRAAAAYAVAHPREASRLLSPAAAAALFSAVRRDGAAAARAAAPRLTVRRAAAACAAATVPLCYAAAPYFL